MQTQPQRQSQGLLPPQGESNELELSGVVCRLVFGDGRGTQSPPVGRPSGDRQLDHDGLCEPCRRSIQISLCDGPQAMECDQLLRDHTSGSAPPRARKPASRSSQQMEVGLHGSKTRPETVSVGRSAVGSTHSRSVCHSFQHSARSLRVVATRSRGRDRRCLAVSPSRREPLVLPSRSPHPSSSRSAYSSESNDHSRCSSVARQALVARSHPHDDRQAHQAAQAPLHSSSDRTNEFVGFPHWNLAIFKISGAPSALVAAQTF